jgi:halogenation protein CepH
MIADFLADAERVTSGPYGEIRVRKDYSYIQEKFWRPGLVLAGDAACFIDPVFSSGVHLATYSALLAARSINTALRASADPDEKTLFEEYEVRYRQEYARFHDFLVAFYDMHSDEQSYFWKAKKVTGNTASEMQSFVDLVGGGSSDERALVDVGSYLGRPEREIDELAWSVAQAGASIQVQAATGGVADEQEPVRPGGLVPSRDGMHWSLPSPTPA